MKIKGVKIEGPNSKDIIIPRANGEDIIFKAVAILDMKNFDLLCPAPIPPQVVGKGGMKIVNPEDSDYKKAMAQWAIDRFHWIVIETLKPSEIEWESVDYANKDTWKNYDNELRKSGFSDFEIGRIINEVLEVNCLNEEKLIEAKKRFLATQVAQQDIQS